MRVCDRHQRTPAVDQIVLTETDSRYDLCQECIDKIAKFLGTEDQKDVEEVKPRRSILGLKRDSA